MVDQIRDFASVSVKPLQVAVAGKGGAGKTTVTAALMKCLTRQELRVFVVDADAGLCWVPLWGVPLSRVVREGYARRPTGRE